MLTIAILLRFMDSFMIYTESKVLTGGGPGNATTFLSIDLDKIALGQFDLGPAGAMSIIYFLIILVLSWLFYTLMMRNEDKIMRRLGWLIPVVYILFLMLPIYWLDEHVVQIDERDPRLLHAVPARLHARQLS